MRDELWEPMNERLAPPGAAGCRVLPAGSRSSLQDVAASLALPAESPPDWRHAAARVLLAWLVREPTDAAPDALHVSVVGPVVEAVRVIRRRCCPMDRNVPHSPALPVPARVRRYSDSPSSFSRRPIYLTPFIAFNKD
jgi:hypothetical protein